MFKIVLRYICRNKKSSIGAIMGIAISAMLMFGLLQLGNSYRSSFKKFASSSDPYDFYVIELTYDELVKINEQFKTMGKDEPDRYLSTIWAGDVTNYTNGKKTSVMGFEGDLEYFKKTALVSGKYPSAENEVCVEESYIVNNPEVKIGDEITLDIYLEDEESNYAKCSRKFLVSGIIKDVGDYGDFFYTDLKTAADIYVENDIECKYSNCIMVEAEEGNYNNEKRRKADVAIQSVLNISYEVSLEDYRYYCHTQNVFNNEKYDIYQEKGAFEEVALTMDILSLIIALCLVIFIYNVVTLSFVRKLDVFGTMRCIGMKNRQLIGFILAEQLIYVIVGSLIGMTAGAFLNVGIAEKLMAALFTTPAAMKVDQSVKTYIMTFLLVLISALMACLKLIFKIRKKNPINIRSFNARPKMFNEKTKLSTIKDLRMGIAQRNLKRGFGKSAIQVVTMVVSFSLCLVISNFFVMIKPNATNGAVDFSDYSFQAEFVAEEYPSFPEEDLELLKSHEGIDKIYTEKCFVEYVWENNNLSLQVLQYDDDLMQKFAEMNKISYDSSKPFSVLLSKNNAEEVRIKRYDDENGDNVYVVKPDEWLNITYDPLNYSTFSQDCILIMNEKLVESLGLEDPGYSAFLVKTDCSLKELNEITFLADVVYITNLHDGQADAEAQLLGMLTVAGYIVVATLVLSFMIVSNTIQENMASKKKEFGIMRAIGLSRKSLCTVACYENLILTLIAVFISLPVSILLNAYFSLILFDEIRISIITYIVVIALFVGIIELIAYLNIKERAKESVVEMIAERE